MLEATRAARADLLDAVEGLPEARRDARWFGDGQWSVRDILAHIYEWQNGFAHALERLARGERPEIPDHNPEDPADTYNALVVERNRHLAWDELLAHLRAARERHEAAVANLVGRLAPDRFEEGRTARRLADSARHDREHMGSILQWRGEQGI